MTRIFSFLTVVLIAVFSRSQQLVEVGNAYANTSINTTVFRNNSLVTHGDTQYISYYDADGYLVIGKRQLSSNEWLLERSNHKGNVQDAHNGISIMVDGEGFLHASFDHHGHPLNYCKSVAPGSIVLGEEQAMTGYDETDVTYPEFYRLAEGNLLFVYRSGSSGRGNMVMKHYSTTEKKWTDVQNILIDGENQRNAYWQLYVDESGVIHLSWVWRETWMVETNHDLCYARSLDQGKTWQKSNGSVYDLPITAATAEYVWHIPENSELINQTSMTADASGHPYIATYWRDAASDIPQYRLVWYDGKGWQQQQVGQRYTPFTLKGGGTKRIPIARPRVVVLGNEVFYIFRDEERGSKVSLAHTSNINTKQWEVTELTDFAVDAWEPSHDTELWKDNRVLHLYVQRALQGDGEQALDVDAQKVYVLEVNVR